LLSDILARTSYVFLISPVVPTFPSRLTFFICRQNNIRRGVKFMTVLIMRFTVDSQNIHHCSQFSDVFSPHSSPNVRHWGSELKTGT
jgi:hypothetical protein